MRPRSLAVLAFLLTAQTCLAAPQSPANDAAYRTPPSAVADLLTAPRVPRGAPNSSPDGAWLAVSDLRSLIPIATLAEPVVKLAGYEVLPEMWAHRNGLKNAAAGLTFHRVSDGTQVRAKVPADVRLGNVRWSKQSDRVACVAFAKGGSELWIVDAATGAAKQVAGVKLHSVSGVLEWANDGKSVLASLVVDGRPVALEGSRIPDGPSLRKGAGKATPQRTARDVLRSPDDQTRFAQLVTAQLAWVTLDGGAVRKVGGPVALVSSELSPDESHLVILRYTQPVPLGFPSYLFPRKAELWVLGAAGSQGQVISLGDVPLNDRSAIASVSPLGPRDFTWAPDGKSLWLALWECKHGD